MIIETHPTLWAIAVNGQIVKTNLPSKMIAESIVMTLPVDHRSIAEIIPVTSNGQPILFG